MSLDLLGDDTRAAVFAMFLAVNPRTLGYDPADLDRSTLTTKQAALADLLTTDFWLLLAEEERRTALAESLDLCPIHFCDADSCADDAEPECEHLR